MAHLRTRRLWAVVVWTACVSMLLSELVGATEDARSQRATGAVSTACAGVVVRPGDDIQNKLKAAPAGSTFCIGAGVYRIPAPLITKSGSTIIGEPGAVISGAKDISRLFVAEGNAFSASGQTQRGSRQGTCRAGTACQYPDDVFVDDRPLERVLSRASLGPGKYFFDYAASKIFLATNPSGHRVEASVIERAFRSWELGIENVTISGLTIEKFTTPSGAAVQAGKSWVIHNCDVRLNHRVGVEGGGRVTDNYIHDNGESGYMQYGAKSLVFSGNEIARNNYLGFSPYWDAGGVKIMVSKNVVLINNNVHDNNGIGMWTDWDNFNVLYERNRVERNAGPGIFHEASADAVIRNNIVRRNGFDSAFSGWLDGSGIGTNSSRNVEIAGNYVEDNRHGIGATQTNRGVGPFGARAIENLYVHDNTIKTMTNTFAAGVVSSYADPDLFARRARFQNNHYRLCAGARFAWRGYGSQAQWLAAGQDVAGTFLAVSAPCALR